MLGIGKIVDAADEYIILENKLKAVTDGTVEFTQAQKGVEKIADDLAQPVSDVADSFLRYKLATESLGASQEEVLDFTKRVTQAMVLSGATSEEAHRAAVQLAQGFGKNFKAAAQDLKSVKEQAPVLARIIEKAAGGLPGSLLVMAKAGKITSKLVFDAVRADGARLDEEWKEHQKTFAEVGNLFGNTILQIVKRLRPYIVAFIGVLEGVAKWFKEWVADGSVMNTVVAGLIVGIGTLTYFFAGLAASVALAAAPFIGLFLILEDFVGFLRGDESLTGDFLENFIGKEQTEKFKASINELITLLGQLFAALFGNEQDSEMAAWRFERAMKGAIDRVWAYAKEKLLGAAQDAADIHPVGPQAQSPEQAAQWKKDHPIVNWLADVTGSNEDILANRRAHGFDPMTGAPLSTAGGGLIGDAALPTPMWTPVGAPAPSRGADLAAPIINNNITVQGNADAPVAREIGTQAGRSVADILGRDRSAVGAGFGIKQ